MGVVTMPRSSRCGQDFLIFTASALALVTGCVVMPRAAAAQSATQNRIDVDISAQDLNSALLLLTQRAGLQIVYDAEKVAGRRSSAVIGRLTPVEALSQLLVGTDLTFRVTGNNRVMLEPAPRSADGAIQLGPVRVEGANSGVAARSPAPGGTATEGTGSYGTRAMATATKLPLSVRETPQSVSIITRQRMDDQNLTSLGDVVANTPGLSVRYADSDRMWFKSRGFLIDTYQSNGITIDTNGDYSAGEDRFDTAIYDRIEVVRGSTGLLTGNGNPSATINLVRKRADRDHFAGTTELSAGSWNNFRGMLDLQSPLGFGGAVRARVVAAYQDKESWLDFYHNRKLVLFGTLAIDIAPDTLLTIGADYQHNDPRGTGWGGDLLWNSDGTRTDPPRSFNTGTRWSSWETETNTQFATLEHRFSDQWNIKAAYAHSGNELDARLMWMRGFPNPVAGAGVNLSPVRYTGNRRQDAVDVSLVGKFSLFGREHDLNLGYAHREVEQNYYRSANSWATTTSIPNYFAWDGQIAEPDWGAPLDFDITSERQQGFYGVARLSLADGLKLIAGGRQSRYRNTTNAKQYSQNVFTPYAGLVWDFTPNLSAYVSYTDIFNPQNTRDRNGDRLPPIRGNTIEAGLKGEWFDGKLSASAAIFEMQQRHVARSDTGYFVPGNPLQQAFIAIDGVRSRGFEVEVTGEIVPGWNVTASWAHHSTRGDDDGDVWSNSQPSDVVRVSTAARVTERLTLGAGVNWQSDDWCTCNGPNGGTYVSQGAYAVVNAMARFDIAPDLSAQVNINNLFDKTYFSEIGFYSRGTYAPPRNVIGTLRYKF